MSQIEPNIAIVRRFYEELWNRWNVPLADELLAPGIRFRGSLGVTTAGTDDFKRYVADVRLAFPDWHNRVDELIATGDKVVARMTWTGTHLGPLLGIEATGRSVTYVGAAIFRLRDAKIVEAWVVGDTQELWRSIGVLPDPA